MKRLWRKIIGVDDYETDEEKAKADNPADTGESDSGIDDQGTGADTPDDTDTFDDDDEGYKDPGEEEQKEEKAPSVRVLGGLGDRVRRKVKKVVGKDNDLDDAEEDEEENENIHSSMRGKKGFEAFNAYYNAEKRIQEPINRFGMLLELLKDSPAEEESVLYRLGLDKNDIEQTVFEIAKAIENVQDERKKLQFEDIGMFYTGITGAKGQGPKNSIFKNVFGFDADTDPEEIQERLEEFVLVMSGYPELRNYSDISKAMQATFYRNVHNPGMGLSEMREGTDKLPKILGFPSERHDIGIRFSKKYKGENSAASTGSSTPETVSSAGIIEQLRSDEELKYPIKLLDNLMSELDKDDEDSVFAQHYDLETDEDVTAVIDEMFPGLGEAIFDIIDSPRDILAVIAEFYDEGNVNVLKLKIINIYTKLKARFPKLKSKFDVQGIEVDQLRKEENLKYPIKLLDNLMSELDKDDEDSVFAQHYDLKTDEDVTAVIDEMFPGLGEAIFKAIDSSEDILTIITNFYGLTNENEFRVKINEIYSALKEKWPKLKSKFDK